jgi:hypothetical protein
MLKSAILRLCEPHTPAALALALALAPAPAPALDDKCGHSHLYIQQNLRERDESRQPPRQSTGTNKSLIPVPFSAARDNPDPDAVPDSPHLIKPAPHPTKNFSTSELRYINTLRPSRSSPSLDSRVGHSSACCSRVITLLVLFFLLLFAESRSIDCLHENSTSLRVLTAEVCTEAKEVPRSAESARKRGHSLAYPRPS